MARYGGNRKNDRTHMYGEDVSSTLRTLLRGPEEDTSVLRKNMQPTALALVESASRGSLAGASACAIVMSFIFYDQATWRCPCTPEEIIQMRRPEEVAVDHLYFVCNFK